jgi:phage RecT family recombinase
MGALVPLKQAEVKVYAPHLQAMSKQILNLLPAKMKDRLPAVMTGAMECLRAAHLRGTDWGPAAAETVRSAVLACARMGWMPGSSMSADAHILPFRNRGQSEFVLVPNFHGLQAAAYRHPKVKSISAGAVCERDEFDYNTGTDPFVKHRKALKDRGEVIGAWALVELDGGRIVEFLNRDEIEAVKAKSPSARGSMSPWADPQAYPWMAAKTAVKAALKRAPRSAELAFATGLDDAESTGEQKTFLDAFVVPEEPTPPAGGQAQAQAHEHAGEPDNGFAEAPAESGPTTVFYVQKVDQKTTKAGKPFWTVAMDDRDQGQVIDASAFDTKVGQAAMNLVGQPVHATVERKDSNGQTYYNLTAIELAAGG